MNSLECSAYIHIVSISERICSGNCEHPDPNFTGSCCECRVAICFGGRRELYG